MRRRIYLQSLAGRNRNLRGTGCLKDMHGTKLQTPINRQKEVRSIHAKIQVGIVKLTGLQ